MNTPRALLPGIAALALVAGGAQAGSNWPNWRGPRGDGHSTESNLPVRWSDADIVWKTELPGGGHSSPVIWGERLFLTTSPEGGRQRVVVCLDRRTGKILWQQIAWTGQPEPSHKMNGWAAATCATDGRYVFAFFGKGGGLFCYRAEDGGLVWNRPLGEFPSPWGTAASPVLIDDLVVQNCESEADARLIAFHKQTGETAWETPLENNRGWSTPVLVEAPGRRELVMNTHTGARGFDPETGKELWHVPAFKGRGETTATPAGGLVHVVEGRTGGLLYAVKPGGSGTLTPGAEHLVWTTQRRGGRDLPSPIVVGGQLLMLDMTGILTAYDPATGQEIWKGRVGGNFAASPVAYQGLAFFVAETGETVVIQPDREMNILARNKIASADDEIFRASLTPSNGQVFLRSDKAVYCIGQRN